MRINKLLSNYGYCSRKEANRIINEKRIYVNGTLCTAGQWVEESDEILLDNQLVTKKESIYLALNKPVGITCTASSDVTNNIIQYINYDKYIFPVGRLDKESQGLILLTNDGELANKIISAEFAHDKEYIVTLNREFDEVFIENMQKGVDIGEITTKPCTVKRMDRDSFNIILTQGLNKQIRRMCSSLGYKVVKLERIRIININLHNLPYGKWRELTKSEIAYLKKI